MKRNSGYEETVWTDDEEPGVVKAAKQPTKKAKVEGERERRFCTSCNRKKQSSDFDEEKKTCRACLDFQRLKRARDANNRHDIGRIVGLNPPKGNRSGLRRESPIVIPSPSELVEESDPNPKAKVACEECRKRHTTCTHIGGPDAFRNPGTTSKSGLIVTLPLGDVGGKGSTQTESMQGIHNKTNKSRTLLPQDSTKQTDETTALDKELREIAHKATMRALKRKLDEAEKVEKKAKSTLAGTQALKKGFQKRVKELNKQEALNHTAAVEAQELIDELKQRIAQQESASKSNQLVHAMVTSNKPDC